MDKPVMMVYIDGSKRSERVLEEIKKNFGDKYHIDRVYREGPSEKIPAVATVISTSLIEGYDNVCRYILGHFLEDKDTGEKTDEKKNEQKYLIELGMPGWTLQGGGYAQPIEIWAEDEKDARQKAWNLVIERLRCGQEVTALRVSKAIVEVSIESVPLDTVKKLLVLPVKEREEVVRAVEDGDFSKAERMLGLSQGELEKTIHIKKTSKN